MRQRCLWGVAARSYCQTCFVIHGCTAAVGVHAEKWLLVPLVIEAVDVAGR